MATPLRVAYLVSRFPQVSETFVVREMNALASRDGIELDLLSLFAPVDGTVHPSARPWLPVALRAGPRDALSGLAWWLRRRPDRLLATVARVVVGHARHPGVLIRALATVALAAGHAREVRRREVDHVHAHFAAYPALAAWVIERLTGVPFSFTAHAHDLFVHQAFLGAKARAARFVVVISEFNRRFLLECCGPLPTPVHVIHCGVDPTNYRFRARAPADDGIARVLCVAALQEKKGHRVLIEALARPALERVMLELVGSGELRSELEELARRVGVAERVRFAGSLPEDEVASRLDAADVFVLPSVVAGNGQMEGIPVALMEALAAGVPVVATRLSGIPELVRDGETGVLAEPGSVEDLTAALEKVLANPAGARERAEAGRRLVEREFDVDASANRLAALFTARSRNAAQASNGLGLAAALATLERAGIPCAVLREPDLDGGLEEVDLLVPRAALDHLGTVLRHNGFVGLGAWGHDGHRFFLTFIKPGAWLMLDVVTALPGADADQVLDERRRRVGVPKPDSDAEDALLLLHCLIDKGGRLGRHRSQLSARAAAGPPLPPPGAPMALRLVWPELWAAVGIGDERALVRLAGRAAEAAGERSLPRRTLDSALRRAFYLWRALAPIAPTILVTTDDETLQRAAADALGDALALPTRRLHVGLGVRWPGARIALARARWPRAPLIVDAGRGQVAGLRADVRVEIHPADAPAIARTLEPQLWRLYRERLSR